MNKIKPIQRLFALVFIIFTTSVYAEDIATHQDVRILSLSDIHFDPFLS
jgi:hypothetical protein